MCGIDWLSLSPQGGECAPAEDFGFGAAAHIIAQVARYQEREVYVFTSPNDIKAQDFARRIGVKWAGGSDETPPESLDAAIIFAPVGPLVPAALRVLERGGTVVCGGIHMSDIPSFPYRDLWLERTILSVANLLVTMERNSSPRAESPRENRNAIFPAGAGE